MFFQTLSNVKIVKPYPVSMHLLCFFGKHIEEFAQNVLFVHCSYNTRTTIPLNV